MFALFPRWWWLVVVPAVSERFVVLLRGVHFGSYKGRGRSVNVDATSDKVIESRASKLLAPLRARGNVTVLACTYKSERIRDWARRSQVDALRVVPWKTPNDLLLAAYAFALEREFDVMVSVRADAVLSKPFVDSLAMDRLNFPWKEANGRMATSCLYKSSAETRKGCRSKWLQNGERYADAIVVAPRRAVPDLVFALKEAKKFHVQWDQHSMFQHLKKQRGYSEHLNVSTIVDGYWNSNPNTHKNPLFSLARKKKMSSSSSSSSHRRHSHPPPPRRKDPHHHS
mmetsp:Transcript_33400/g.106579  ORF Transcript_33400/g.106579 Transcript_33400/m.106579 type:complete len:284 (+) Transcript_33400:37-888(+)|eukprot:CAMPEP_0118918022 /NCGR_PEP_ID=MMETSP1166-20130328/17666_1 /TAXON_ID=1104430 /ORGANISM="Chrysoreinhardia sp, Strain CCMP3193" /LENGTH=283 /DNA_ID=CAMNT_0006858265 /DNA_START=1 /DNA_END=852 /DNA_ORIENTATION=+